ncbi:MAG: ribbon-helix-helix domain-containing protein [Candidatus Caldarchaeum sp.]
MTKNTEYARKRRTETAKKDIKIRLDQDLARQLDVLAETLNVSRGSLIERALDLWLTLKGHEDATTNIARADTDHLLKRVNDLESRVEELAREHGR